MSKIKERYWNFINSEDYSDYYLNEQQYTRSKASNQAYEQLSAPSEYRGSSKLQKRIVELSKRLKGHA
jgi:hypothetical protein